MQTQISIERYLGAVGSGFKTWRLPRRRSSARSAPCELRAVTISRQSGSGGRSIAQCLSLELQSRMAPASSPWTVFDWNLIEKVREEHRLPPQVVRFMPEDGVSAFADALDELLGIHPPTSQLVEQTTETIWNLANRGNAILVGRGAHVITRALGDVFHVRLVGSLNKRVEHMRELHAVSEARALAIIRHEDQGRRRYLKKHFGEDIDDPLAYDLTLNTDCLPYDRAARLIADAAMARVRA